MNADPVLAEIRATRAAYAERFHGDVTAMLDDLRKREKASGRELVTRVVKVMAAIQPSVVAGSAAINDPAAAER